MGSITSFKTGLTYDFSALFDEIRIVVSSESNLVEDLRKRR
jgi:hypothetical protein